MNRLYQFVFSGLAVHLVVGLSEFALCLGYFSIVGIFGIFLDGVIIDLRYSEADIIIDLNVVECSWTA